METITFKIKGTVPLLMHNGQMASPFNEYAKQLKEISGKRKKTDEDFEAMALIEARGGLYFDKEAGVYIPGENIEAAIIAGAKLKKLGTTFKRGLRVIDIKCSLDHIGPSSPDELIRNPDFIYSKLVKVGTSRILRTRPIFNEWGTSFSVAYAPDQVDKNTVIQAIKDTGELVGIGDWRPRFGLFEVTKTS